MMFHYDRIPKASSYQEYLDVARNRGRLRAARVKRMSDRNALLREKERERMRAIKESLLTALRKLHDSYPSFDHLGEFIVKIFALDMDPGRVKQALGGVNHAITTVQGLTTDHIKQMKLAESESQIIKVRKAYLGRVSSVMRQTDRHLKVLNEARAVFRSLPAMDPELFTVAIAGFPNVGKSTLLGKMTGAKPEIRSYAFTTKGLNVGYFEFKYNRIQCVDTPGTLNRKRMNDVERRADLTLHYFAHAVVYVFDPTEGSFPLKDQERLYDSLQELEKPIIIYISKTDIADKEAVKSLIKKYPDSFTDPEKVKKGLGKLFKEWL